jgi:gamma-glutamyltranspeptidase/glutathione hydrolase
MITAPHHLVAEVGADILRQGGNAVEAMVAAAATIAVVYPHMNSIGGDGFWLISEPGKKVCAIEACGPAATRASLDFYRQHDCTSIPARGPLAALTMAGTLSGWQKALELYGGGIPLADLLAPAIDYARDGVVITRGQADLTVQKWPELEPVEGFATTYAPEGIGASAEGKVLKQAALARTLEQLAIAGLDDFYRGDLAIALAKGLERAGSPLGLDDFNSYSARLVEPLQGAFDCGQVFNMPPPTQGISSLLILGQFEKMGIEQAESFAHHHAMIEAVKQAFILRNAHVTDPDDLSVDVSRWLDQPFMAELRSNIDMHRAQPWPYQAHPGDTVWMGCADRDGCVVSFIQSTYWEYGSGVVAGDTGVVWQNRGSSFSLKPEDANVLRPGKRPFHTLNPALARLTDGRVLAYGTMGGEGQPQTQAQFFTRHVLFGMSMQQAITAPRWLLGRTWGEEATNLKLEEGFDPALVDQLVDAGHEVERVAPLNSIMGHAGAVSLSRQGIFEGAFDPRSDGSAVGL